MNMQTANPHDALEAQLAEIRRQEQAERQRAKIEALLKMSGIPKRFGEVTFDGFEPRTRLLEAAKREVMVFTDRFDDIARTGRSLILTGDAGTGKTHLACSMVRALCQRGRRAKYVTFGDAVRRIRNCWRKDWSETELDVLDELRDQDLLVVDEIGVQYGTEGEQNHAFDIIDGRYRDMRPTIIVTNCNPEGLISYLGARVVDRLLENDGRMLRFDGPSNRTRKVS